MELSNIQTSVYQFSDKLSVPYQYLNHYPIGVFDSGLGGLSIWLELVKLMPNEQIIYYADSDNCPYGNRSKEEIIDLSIRCVKFLLAKGVKLIVIACNTATTNTINILQKRFNVPFIGIEPALELATKQTKTNNIGVLATKGTLGSTRFREAKNHYAKNFNIYLKVGKGLAEAVENQAIRTDSTKKLVQQYIRPMLKQNVDKIILGCTHYPFLKPIFEQVLPQNVDLINPAPFVAKQTLMLLQKLKLQDNRTIPKYEFYTSGNMDTLKLFLNYIGVDNRRFNNLYFPKSRLMTNELAIA